MGFFLPVAPVFSSGQPRTPRWLESGAKISVSRFLFSRRQAPRAIYSFIAWVGTIRRESTTEESSGVLLAIKMKVCTVVGRGENSLLSDPGSELLTCRKGEGEEGKSAPRQ